MLCRIENASDCEQMVLQMVNFFRAAGQWKPSPRLAKLQADLADVALALEQIAREEREAK